VHSPEEGEDGEEECEQPTAAVILLAAVAQGQLDKGMVLVDQCEVDEVEEQLIQRFVQDRCKCDLGSPCCTTITVEHSWSVHCQMAELTHDELDFVVMAQVMMAGLETSPHHGQERGQSYIIFNHNGVSVCQKTFRARSSFGLIFNSLTRSGT